MKIISNTKRQTGKLAKALVEKILRLKKFKGAVVIGLSGELGAGKTIFCKSFARALGVKEKIHSPTFIIFRKHEIHKKNFQFSIFNFQNLYHFDAYRIKNKKDILALGWKKIISEPKNIILVEWAENIRKIFPKKHFWINLAHLGKNKRGIDIKSVK